MCESRQMWEKESAREKENEEKAREMCVRMAMEMANAM